MTRYIITIAAALCWLMLAAGSAFAALYSQWDSVAPILDAKGDATSGIDIDSIRYVRDAAGTYYFRMDVNGDKVIKGTTYSFFVANSAEALNSHDSLFSFSKTFTSSNPEPTANYGKVNDNKFYLEWSLQNASTLNPLFFITGSTFLNSGRGHSDTMSPVSVNNVATTPIPPAAWLLGSGLLALIGLSRKI